MPGRGADCAEVADEHECEAYGEEGKYNVEGDEVLCFDGRTCV